VADGGGLVNITGREKATIFLSILGSDTAARILRYLPEELADVIATSINHLPTPTPDALGAVLKEFKSGLALRAPIAPPPPQIAEEAVIAEDDSPLGRLNAAYAKRLAQLFSFERPQVAAFVLSMLNPAKKEEVLMNLGPQKGEIDNLIKTGRSNKFTEMLKSQLLELFAGKL